MNEARLGIRLRAGAKELIQRAAALTHQTVSQFAVAILAAEAERVVAAHRQTALSDRDRDRFLRLLDEPPKPNAALRKAAAAYRERMDGQIDR